MQLTDGPRGPDYFSGTDFDFRMERYLPFLYF